MSIGVNGISIGDKAVEYPIDALKRPAFRGLDHECFRVKDIEVDAFHDDLVPPLHIDTHKIETVSKRTDRSNRNVPGLDNIHVRLDHKGREGVLAIDIKGSDSFLNSDTGIYNFISGSGFPVDLAQMGIRFDADAARSVPICPIGIAGHFGMVGPDVEIANRFVAKKESQNTIFTALGVTQISLKEFEKRPVKYFMHRRRYYIRQVENG
jgi:hypothetical protein